MARRTDKVQIRQVPTGVPNLDVVLGGGLPAYSINVVAGPPGSGKTSLAQQFLFHNATPDQKGIYIATLGEPLLKLVRYQQQFTFFDPDKLNSSIFFFDLAGVVRDEGLKRTLEVIRERVDRVVPSFLVIDSFKSLEDSACPDGDYSIRAFIHELGVHLAAWEITSLLLGEYSHREAIAGAEFSMADGIIWLDQQVRQNSMVRKLQVVKLRGQAAMPGCHTFRITEDGLLLFPRAVAVPPRGGTELPTGRASFGVPGLDEMMRGGIPTGQTCLIAGSSGTGKTLLSLHFIVEGARIGQAAVMVTFEEDPREHERKAAGFGWNLGALEEKGLLKVIYLRPTDLSVDEVLYEVNRWAAKLRATRVVINSVSGFEMSISPADQEDFREALYRLLTALSSQEVTTLLTTEVPDLTGSVQISPQRIAFLADNVILLRYAEIESQLRKALMVVKMRTSDHDKELRQYQITDKGVQVEKAFTEYSGILSGIPTLRTVMGLQPFTTGLSDQEEALMHVLLALPNSDVQQLAESMGLKPGEVQGMLDKLVDTGYVLRTAKGGRTVYRVTLIAPGAVPKRPKR
ncbi:MAG: ATPase domain-containing protein [Sphingomonadaceae bacterium]